MEILLLAGYFFSLSYDLASLYKFTSVSPSIIWSHLITESSIIFAKYLVFLQPHVAGFQI